MGVGFWPLVVPVGSLEQMSAFRKFVAIRKSGLDVCNESMDRGRELLSPSPPSEPGVQFSRDGLSSQLFPHRDWRANLWASDIVNNPRLAKKAFGHCL